MNLMEPGKAYVRTAARRSNSYKGILHDGIHNAGEVLLPGMAFTDYVLSPLDESGAFLTQTTIGFVHSL